MQHLLEDFLPDRFGHYGSRKKVQFFRQGSNNTTKKKSQFNRNKLTRSVLVKHLR